MSSFHRTDWLSLASPIITLLIVAGGYGVAYWQEKGKNRATAEDIDRLTRTVESIKTENAVSLANLTHQNGLLLEQLKSRQQLRVAAIDKRLQAHQEAFTLWRGLMAFAHSERVGEVIVECQTWWEHNALYLEPQVREAFNRAYFAAASHRSLVNVPDREESTAATVRENWKLIMEAGDVILEAVELPALNEREQSTKLPTA
ncbi:hypothetical protein [Paraburkholderia saeva]|uniref:Uncharacterized protein n=1 Tax=Paraburkholderia saeva TaxID=2777537 RepID=A0A9N8X3B9_9BURK|nr:hypothetical protein [Paraburkholderia saeva]CAG4919194.1 hypothetical protein LMG31841_04853 [Paraburkholderia saeva]